MKSNLLIKLIITSFLILYPALPSMAQPDVTFSVGDGVGSSCLTRGNQYTNCSKPVCYEAGFPCSVGDVDCYLYEDSLCICNEGAGFELKNPCDQKTVAISLENLNDRIKGLSIRIRDVDNYLRLTGCETTERAAGLICFSNDIQDDPIDPSKNGTFEIALADLAEPIDYIEPGTGPIVRLTFQVSSAAPLGECRALIVELASAADEFFGVLEVATEDGEFCFNTPPLCVEVSPGSLMQGDTGEEITITGQNTNFLQGVNDVIFSNTGITVDSFTVDSDTQIRATISIAGDAPTGVGDLTVDAVAGGVDCVGAFEVLGRVQSCVDVDPGSGMQGQILQLDIAGMDTQFTQGSTPVVSFGASGIIVNGVTVVHDELLRVDIFIPETVTPGFVSVTVTTDQGVIQCTNAFEVTEKVESCLGVVPGSGMQDSQNVRSCMEMYLLVCHLTVVILPVSIRPTAILMR